jgi:hypothetical protein
LFIQGVFFLNVTLLLTTYLIKDKTSFKYSLYLWTLSAILEATYLPSWPPYQLTYQFVQSCSGTRYYLEVVFHYLRLMIRYSFPVSEPSSLAAKSDFWPFEVLHSLYRVQLSWCLVVHRK